MISLHPFPLLFLPLGKVFSLTTSPVSTVWHDYEAVLKLRWPFDFQRTERDQNTYIVYNTEIKA